MHAQAGSLSVTLVMLGALFVLGLLGTLLAQRTAIPRVSLMLLLGFAVGPAGLDWLPAVSAVWFEAVTSVALAMVGFLLGQRLTFRGEAGYARQVLWISLVVICATALIVFGGLYALTGDPLLALLLCGVALSTDPAATLDIIREQRATGPFSELLQGIVAVDDAWGVVVFSLVLVLASAMAGDGGAGGSELAQGAWELLGAVLVGVGIGVPMAFLTGRVAAGEPTQAEALGGVLLCAGLALALGVSYILASMALGAVVVNLAAHHRRPFAAIEGIEWPFMLLFFLLSGAALDLDAVLGVGAVGVAYLLLRTLGRVVGGWAGGRLGGSNAQTARWIGPALLPQAGVAIGLGLYAAQRFPDYASTIIAIVVGSTVLFELVGPFVTRRALVALGESQEPRPGATG